MLTDKERILVLGCSGSGKTCLSRQLSGILDLPLIHLDAHFWNPGWKETPTADWMKKVAGLLQRPRSHRLSHPPPGTSWTTRPARPFLLGAWHRSCFSLMFTERSSALGALGKWRMFRDNDQRNRVCMTLCRVLGHPDFWTTSGPAHQVVAPDFPDRDLLLHVRRIAAAREAMEARLADLMKDLQGQQLSAVFDLLLAALHGHSQVDEWIKEWSNH